MVVQPLATDALRPCQREIARHQDDCLLLLTRPQLLSPCSHGLRVKLCPRLRALHRPRWGEFLQRCQHLAEASGTASRGTELHRTGDVAGCDWCVHYVCPVTVWPRWRRRWQFRFSCSFSSRRRRWCTVPKRCNSAAGIRR